MEKGHKNVEQQATLFFLEYLSRVALEKNITSPILVKKYSATCPMTEIEKTLESHQDNRNHKDSYLIKDNEFWYNIGSYIGP